MYCVRRPSAEATLDQQQEAEATPEVPNVLTCTYPPFLDVAPVEKSFARRDRYLSVRLRDICGQSERLLVVLCFCSHDPLDVRSDQCAFSVACPGASVHSDSVCAIKPNSCCDDSSSFVFLQRAPRGNELLLLTLVLGSSRTANTWSEKRWYRLVVLSSEILWICLL